MKKIKYGDKTLDMPEGMTLDQAKAQMARFFPELAEPEVKTEKKNDDTIYIFSKKAGRKGGEQVAVDADRLMLQICAPKDVYGVQLWVANTTDGPQFLGALLDAHGKRIQGSTLWSPAPDVASALIRLAEIAANYEAAPASR